MGIAYQFPRVSGVTPAADLGVFALELFVDGKEMLDFAQYMGRKVGVSVNRFVKGAVDRDGEHFFIGKLLIEHFQDTDGPGGD